MPLAHEKLDFAIHRKGYGLCSGSYRLFASFKYFISIENPSLTQTHFISTVDIFFCINLPFSHLSLEATLVPMFS